MTDYGYRIEREGSPPAYLVQYLQDGEVIGTILFLIGVEDCALERHDRAETQGRTWVAERRAATEPSLRV